MKANHVDIKRSNPLPRAVWQMLVIVTLAAIAAFYTNNMRADGIPLVADWSPALRLQAATGNDDLVIPMVQAIAAIGGLLMEIAVALFLMPCLYFVFTKKV